jgi:hypothetical protein
VGMRDLRGGWKSLHPAAPEQFSVF